jgi:predicted RNA-binding protein
MYSYLKKDIKESEIPIDVREAKKVICDLIDEKQKIIGRLRKRL